MNDAVNNLTNPLAQKPSSQPKRSQIEELQATYQTRSLHCSRHPRSTSQSWCKGLGHQRNSEIPGETSSPPRCPWESSARTVSPSENGHWWAATPNPSRGVSHPPRSPPPSLSIVSRDRHWDSLWHLLLYHRRIHSLWTEGFTSKAGSKPSKGHISKASFVPVGAGSVFSEGSKTQSLSKWLICPSLPEGTQQRGVLTVTAQIYRASAWKFRALQCSVLPQRATNKN